MTEQDLNPYASPTTTGVGISRARREPTYFAGAVVVLLGLLVFTVCFGAVVRSTLGLGFSGVVGGLLILIVIKEPMAISTRTKRRLNRGAWWVALLLMFLYVLALLLPVALVFDRLTG